MTRLGLFGLLLLAGAAADLDGDRTLDLFVPHREGGQSIILWNDGKGQFDVSTKVGPATTAARIGVAGDLNGQISFTSTSENERRL